MLESWQAVILGLIEGITEYLPISSTGHLIVGASVMGLHDDPRHAAAVKTFEIAIQAGAIAAVLGLYFPRFARMVKGLMGRDPQGLSLLVNLLIAFAPAAAVGWLLHDFIDAYLMNLPAVVIAFLLGGVFMIVVDRKLVSPRRFAGPGGAGKDVIDLTPGEALKIGLLQCVALWPGTSRSMMTITGGAISGLRPAAAAEFSFLLGVPTLMGATVYSIVKNLSAARAERLLAQSENRLPRFGTFLEDLGAVNVALGALVAAASAAAAVYWLVGFLNRRGLAPFGYYRLAAALVLFVMMVLGVAKPAPKHGAPPVRAAAAAASHAPPG
ncbi:MAG TPA: undecaprenyl-diphosphate phosphatase [Phycisphaerales bacterium]|nr:undecaprenyl-diphosphate phosphatase [Phycisphaerales bacterium]